MSRAVRAKLNRVLSKMTNRIEEKLDALLQKMSDMELKIEMIQNTLKQHAEPLEVMHRHVHNVEAVAQNVPIINRLWQPQSLRLIRRIDSE